MNLLIDMGNTRLKWAVIENRVLKTGEAMLNAELNRDALINTWQNLASVEQLAIACVSGNPLLELVLAVAGELWPGVKIRRAKSASQAMGVRNAYTQPEKLGVDRWLVMLAVRHNYPLPACIVDCGTAITVDLLDGEGHHQGGLISPGLSLMKKSLSAGTSALPYNDSPLDFGLADNTEAAIYSGTLTAACGLIEYVLARQEPPVHLILTGGDAALVARHLSVTATLDMDLVLRGLALILD